ncbi:MAG: hypothetical protein OEM96_10280 [Gemmatimonadota bacterium]|nr:hypothetical protein [Gemmatimonadota bacterium]
MTATSDTPTRGATEKSTRNWPVEPCSEAGAVRRSSGARRSDAELLTETDPPLTELILTFVPIYAVLATIIAALATRGRWRWLMLAVVPAIGTMLSWAALPLTGDGNMLSVTLVLLLVTGLMAYYPVLAITALVVWYRTRRSLA